MNRFNLICVLAVLFSVLVSKPVVADIPYQMRDGIEEVDYEKLNPILGFKLPDSGQFRDSTYVHGEDEDYSRNPMSFDFGKDKALSLILARARP